MRERAREFGWGHNWPRGVSEWGVGSKRRLGSCGGDQETRGVGASTAGCEGGRLGKQRGLMVGSAGQRERTHERAVSADIKDPPSSERERACAREDHADRPAPPGSGREREKERALIAEVRLSGRAGACASWASSAVLGQNEFFLFLGNF
jgi:hypothetical protein